MAEIECHKKKTPMASKIAEISMDKKQTHTLDRKVYPPPKRRRMLQPSNDEGIFPVPIESEHTGTNRSDTYRSDTYRSDTTIECVLVD